jgi:WD40 repeat protein
MRTVIIYTILLFTLLPQVFAQKLSIQTGHSAGITDLLFSPDGKYLFSSGEDSKVILWDMVSSRQMNIFTGHIRRVNALALHPSKSLIASASDDKTVRIWEYPSGKLVKTFDFFEHPVKSLGFNSNGFELACGSDVVYIVDIQSGVYRKIGKPSKKGYNAVSFSKDEKYLAYGGKRNGLMYLYNLTTEKITKRYNIRANDILFDEGDKYLYAAGQKGNIIREPLSGALYRKSFNISTNNSWNSFNAIAINKEYFIGANGDNLIYIYDRGNGARNDILKSHTDEVWALAIEPKGRFLASAGKDRKILIWDLKKHALVKKMEGGSNRINSINFSENGKIMFIAYHDGSYRIWNLDQKGKVIYQDPNKLSRLEKYMRYKYSANEANQKINTNRILVKTSLNLKEKYSDEYKSRETLIIWKLREGLKTHTLKSPKTSIYQSFMIKDTSEVILLKSKGTHSQKYSMINKHPIREREQIYSTKVYSLDVTSVKKDKKLDTRGIKNRKLVEIEGDLYYASLDPSGNTLMVLLHKKKGESEIQLWDLLGKTMISSHSFEETYEAGGISNTGKYLYLASANNQTVKILDAQTFEPKFHYQGTLPVSFSPDDQLVSYADELRNIYLVNLKTNNRIFKSNTGHSSDISEIKFNIPYNYLATSGHDGLIRFWDMENGSPIVSLAAFGEDDFIYINPDNYYYSTKGAMNYIAFMEKERLYTFEQFDVKFNRPDIVFSKMKYSSPEEIDAYHKAYVKRVQKMGFANFESGGELNIPQINILNLDEFPISTLNGDLTIVLNGRDSLENIDRFHIWVNDVPVFGTNGYSVSNKKSNNITVDLPVKLSAGRNKIQVATINQSGVESLKETFSIIYDIKETKPDLYLVTIGVSNYLNPEYNLQYAAKDADDITKMFKTEKNKVFGNVHNIKILNNEATVANILKLKNSLDKTRVDDVVLLFFAGHGVLDAEMNYYLATTEIEMDNMARTALKYDFFEGLFDNIPARKKVIIIDACHSGEVDKEEEFAEVETEEDVMFVIARDVNSAASLESRAKISTQKSFELMKMMFADIRRGTGSTVISSAGGGEYAYETEQTKNGIFTYVLINGIMSKKADLNKDGTIMVSELRDYVSTTVSRLTKGSQNPTSRRENLEFDFRLW